MTTEPEPAPHDFRPAPSEPAVRHPGLRALVDAARDVPAPVVTTSAQAIFAGWQRERARQRRGLVLGLVAVAAAVVLLVVGGLGLRSTSDDREGASTIADGAPPPRALDDGAATGPHRPPAEPGEPPPIAAPVLAASIAVVPLDATSTAPQVLGARRLQLSEGRFSIDSQEPEPVEVVLPDGALELRGGSVHVQVAGDVAHVEVLREQVLRIDLTGRATPLRPSPSEATAPTATAQSPAALAREAEELMAAGNRAGAIRVLRRLVTRHGRSAAAQAGLIDLGRLLKAAGQPDEARCAYGLFLARWPGHALAGDVTRAREALGPGPACEGLRPRAR